MREQKLIDRCVEIIGCDAGRIVHANGTMYFIKRELVSTADDKDYQPYINGRPLDYDYYKETVVGGGETAEELISQCGFYKRASSMSIEEYYLEVCI